MQSLIKKLPGFIVSLVIAIGSYYIAQLWLPMLGGATIALFVGIILGNTWLKQPGLAAGTKFSEKRLLEYSVMLLGATITFQSIQKIGWQGVVLTVLQMSLTIGFAIWLGRRLRFSEGTYLLMAGGNAVCGSSAIGAIAPVIDADNEDTGIAITMVNLMGTILMLALPVLGTLLWGHDNLARGILIGGTVQSVGQVVASATMINQGTVVTATLFKILRIIFLVFVVTGFGYLHQKKQSQATDTKLSQQLLAKKSSLVPWYVLGFLIFCVINSLHLFPGQFGTICHFLSTWCEMTALAAIGLRLNLKTLFNQGKQLLFYAGGLVVFQVAAAILLITILF
ncbi:putative sulfate exporter family transporter [Latilactobacillus sakei]|uniref:YeiH family protein n=1 Tax=Latilactobacillus sakei TaxID=1599 RepID=UPI00338E13E8